VFENEFNRKMEIELQMNEDKEREAKRVKADEEMKSVPKVKVGSGVLVKKTGSGGVVKKPLVQRRGRGF